MLFTKVAALSAVSTAAVKMSNAAISDRLEGRWMFIVAPVF